mmetsp:Transcript_39709/g.80001  ORF Transcript_39709/g.80001 Transcript_39709/m.80001 type:complete len:173 (+) Transcript_39709:163-681(+)
MAQSRSGDVPLESHAEWSSLDRMNSELTRSKPAHLQHCRAEFQQDRRKLAVREGKRVMAGHPSGGFYSQFMSPVAPRKSPGKPAVPLHLRPLAPPQGGGRYAVDGSAPTEVLSDMAPSLFAALHSPNPILFPGVEQGLSPQRSDPAKHLLPQRVLQPRCCLLSHSGDVRGVG